MGASRPRWVWLQKALKTHNLSIFIAVRMSPQASEPVILATLGQSEFLSNTAVQTGLHGSHPEIGPSLPQKQDTAIQYLTALKDRYWMQ